ncbi:IclR family transcriptional regulator [Streptosporangium sp. NPDC006007]|uniref:IclR family transcriptional regulator n=1 Tax=Streptosporangium sp. NPDC006007 TaxID=3154575 RepID=UPI0033AB283D
MRVDKAIRVLLSFADGKPHGVRDLSRDMGLPKSTVSRLILDLAEAGLVTQEEESGRYRLGAGAARLGRIYLDGLDVRTVAMPIMAQLQEETGETVGLHVREGSERVVIASAESRAVVRSGFSVGERLPLHAGAGGKALLAFEPDQQREEIIDGLSFTRLTERTILDPRELRRELDVVRGQGYATSANEVSLQSASVAAPVFAGDGHVAAVLIVTGPVFRMSRKVLSAIAPLTVRAARAISAKLGGES